MPTIPIRWSDNTEELRRHLAEGLNQIEATRAGAEKLAKSLAGENLIAAAHKYAAAVESIGGAAKLTASNQERVNSVMTRAVEQLNAAGKGGTELAQRFKALAEATKNVEAEGLKAGKTLDVLKDRLTSVAQGARTIGTTLTAGVTAPLLAVGVLSTKAAIDFESSFTGLRKTVAGVVDDFGEITPAGAKLQQQFRDLAKEIPVSVVELNRIGEAAGQLGIKKEDILQFTKTMAILGVTTNLTADEAANATARIQNIFGAAGKDTDRFASSLVALGNFGASTEKDIIDLGERIAGAGKIAGLAQSDILGIGNALASVGVEAEAGGTAVQKVLLAMTKSVVTGSGKLAEFAKIAGMSANEFAAAFKGNAAGAFTSFVEGLGKAGTGAIQALDDVGLHDQRLIRSFLSLAGAGSLLRDSIELGSKAWQENTAATKEAEQRFRTFASQFQLLKNQLYDVAITIGTAMLPTLKDLINLAKPVAGLLASMAEEFAKLPEPVRASVIGLAAIAAAVGPATFVFGSLAGAIGNLIPLVKLLGAAEVLGTATTGIRGIATAITAAGAAAAESSLLIAALSAGLVGLAFGGLAVLAGKLKEMADARATAMLAEDAKRASGPVQDLAGNLKYTVEQAKAANDAAGEAGVGLTFMGRALKGTGESAKAAVSDVGAFTAQIRAAQKELDALSPKDRADIAAGLKSHVADLKEVEKQYHLSEDAVKLFQRQLEESSKSAGHAAAELKKYETALADLASRGTSYNDVLSKMDGFDIARIKRYHELGGTVEEIATVMHKTKGEIDAVIDAMKVEALIVTASGAAYAGLTKHLETVEKARRDLGNSAFSKNLAAETAAMSSAIDTQDKLQLSSYEYQRTLIEKRAADEKRATDATGANFFQAIIAIETNAAAQYDSLRALHYKFTGDVNRDADLRGIKTRQILEDELRVEQQVLSEMLAHREQFTDAAIKSQQDVVRSAKVALGQLGPALLTSLEGSLNRIPDLLKAAFTGGGGMMGAIKAILTDFGTQVGQILTASLSKSLTNAMSHHAAAAAVSAGVGIGETLATTGAAAAGSAVAGGGAATAGGTAAAAGGIGVSLATAGITLGVSAAIIGGILLYRKLHLSATEKMGSDIGRDLGVGISKELLKTITADGKSIGRQAAEIFNLKAILDENGGITPKNFDLVAGKLHDVFSLIETGQLSVAQGAKVLDENWSAMLAAGTDSFGFIDAKLTDIIRLDGIFGTQSKEIAGFLKAQGAAAVTASNAIIGGIAKQVDGWKTLKQRIDDARKAGSNYSDMLAEQRGLAADNRAELENMGVIALATFSAAVASGATFAEALAAAGPGLQTLTDGFDALGISTNNAALQALMLQSSILTRNPSLIAAVGGLGQAFAALSNMGLLNVDTFHAMQETGLSMYARLQGEAAALGGTTRDALLPMQDYLHSAENAAKDLGIPLDDNTQILIDQSKELGIWRDAGKSATDKLIGGMQTLVDKVQSLINHLLGIPDVDFDVTQHNHQTTDANPTANPNVDPGPDVGRAATGGRVTATGIQPFGGGGRVLPWPQFKPIGTDTVPAMLTPGELVLNHPQETQIAAQLDAGVRASEASAKGQALVSTAGSGEDHKIELHNHIYLNSKEVTRQVIEDVKGGGTPYEQMSRLVRQIVTERQIA